MASARTLYEDWKASGDTQREVAERHGMNYNTVRGKIGEFQREMKAMEDADDDADADDAPEEAAPDATDDALRRFLQEQGVSDTAVIKSSWVKGEHFSVYVQPNEGPTLDDVIEQHVTRIREAAQPYRVPSLRKAGRMSVIPTVFDLHGGKLAIDETYTLDRQAEDYLLAIDATLAYCATQPWSVEQFIFPIGNDILHSDTIHGTTTKGTPLEMNASPMRVFDAMVYAVHEAVRRLATVAPVDVLNVRGNHDSYTSHMLAKVIEASFTHHDGVTVDTGHQPRKYRRVGPTSLMFLHGDSVPITSYPGQYLMEAGEMCGGAPYYVVIKGHLHKRGGTYQVITEDNGVQARTIPSLCKSDQYHLLHGYGAQRSAEVHLFDRERGPRGIYPVFADELQTLSAPAALAAD